MKVQRLALGVLKLENKIRSLRVHLDTTYFC